MKAKKKTVKKKSTASRKKVKKAIKRKVARKVAKRPAAPKSIGKVTHFYGGIKVAVVKFSKTVKRGTEVTFKGATTDFKQKLDSMQYDHKSVASAPKGKQVGVKVKSRVREGDKIYS